MFNWMAERRTRRMVDTTAACDGGATRSMTGTMTGTMTGLTAGTRVATTLGWRDVAALQPGDMVLTFDGGLQPISRILRRPLWSGQGACPRQFWPLLVPAGALENAKPMKITPRQGVLLESDAAEEVLGDPFALVPAESLEGVNGIERTYPNDPIDVYQLAFDEDQVIFAEQGALLLCPAAGDLVQLAVCENESTSPYRMLPDAVAGAVATGNDQRSGKKPCKETLRAALQGVFTQGRVHPRQVA
ncbi:Hint domain-containing protein [Rhodalgimonas zhirmunskyi]|uniref:Hint domain-containing protein n=1 Tax=Rhodalgimonas zhirmunskyi TaxID=2964767 RepID=A0AAJ1UBN0_9RHOB|nr:Hint domain-containing protein [Rhodoalgimonas zhirmunskyi]MDQ2095520.1 Hint domain-containing protein [Rhodoalgimonas zhirmunskyi]